MRKYYWAFVSLFIVALLAMLYGCGAVSGDVDTLTISPASATVIKGGTLQFSATARNEIDEIISITPSWTVSDPNVGTISATGLFYSNLVGTADVIAAADDVTARAPVSVITGELTITVTPETPTMGTAEAKQFYATGKNPYGIVISISPTWEATPSSIGTIDATGYFISTAEVGGIGTIKARASGKEGSTTVTVTP